MALLDVLVPQMGEGLQEVVIVGFHKKPGETVKRDELLYSMETDKAVMDVESPYDGVLVEWMAEEGAVLPIGTPVARMESDAAPAQRTQSAASGQSTAVPSAAASPQASANHSGLVVPPRTRALCKERGISEEEMAAIPAAGSKLMPSDVEAYLAARAGSSGNVEQSATSAPDQPDLQLDGSESPAEPDGVPRSVTAKEPARSANYRESPLPTQQRVFTSRIRRSADLVIPATMTRPIRWEPVAQCTLAQREQDFTFRPTEFQTLAWCIARATQDHPRLRSTLHGDDVIREYDHVNLGIAVALKSGDLVTAVIRNADALEYLDFVREAQSAIGTAREGKDQADEATQLHVTYMGAYGITEATPLLVHPAIGVLFVGAAYPREGGSWVNLTLTFDHRAINGVEGARFLKTIAELVNKLDEIV